MKIDSKNVITYLRHHANQQNIYEKKEQFMERLIKKKYFVIDFFFFILWIKTRVETYVDNA